MGTRSKSPCRGRCAISAVVDKATLEKLEVGHDKLLDSDSTSLLRMHFTNDIMNRLKMKRTAFGSTLLDCVQSGLTNYDSSIGIYAPDADAYKVFAELYDPIIADYHMGFTKTSMQPQKDWGDVGYFCNIDPTGKYVVSTRVRCGRSLTEYPFNPCLTQLQYKDIEKKVVKALSSLEGDLKGQYHPLFGMEKEVQDKLIKQHFLFKEGDKFLEAANANRFWPMGRGIYYNENRTFLVWINEEDHIRFISMENGGNLGTIYKRFVDALTQMEKLLTFTRDDRLGFLTFCPTNLGTSIRASVHIKVPKLAQSKGKLDEIAAKYNLQVRGSSGEHSEAKGGIYDISNKQRMGITEFEAVKTMQDGILAMIKMEKTFKK